MKEILLSLYSNRTPLQVKIRKTLNGKNPQTKKSLLRSYKPSIKKWWTSISMNQPHLLILTMI